MNKKNLNPLILFIFVSSLFGSKVLENFETTQLKGWFFVGDQGSGGASVCSKEIIEEDSNKVLKWDYKLQKTDLWEWCYTTVGLNFDTPQDFSSFKGLQFRIKSIHPQEYININLVTKDKNLNTNKYSQYIIKISSYWQVFSIPFEKFRIVGWWKARNKNYNNSIELDNVVGIEFSKSGISLEKGSIYIDDIELYDSESKGILNKKDFVINEITTSIKQLSIENTSIAEIKIYTNQPFNSPYKDNKGKISAYLYGTNWGQWLCSFPSEDLVKPLNIKVLRTGGNLMSRYNWKTSKYKDTSIGEPYINQIPTIDEFVQYCRKIGAEPLIQINMLGYAPNEKNDNFEYCMDEKDAAELVYYLNKEKKYNVRFFEMDNEPFIWHLTHKDVIKQPLSVNEYFEKLKKFVITMRETQRKINPNLELKIFAPAICTSWIDWGTYADTNYYGCEGAVDLLLKKCAEFEKNKRENPKGYKLIDVLSFHIYPRFRVNWEDPYDFIPQGPQAMLDSTRTFWDEDYINYYDYNQARGIATRVIPRFNEWIKKYYPSVELAITEINVDSMGRIYYPNFVRPLFMADIYGIAAKYGVDYIMQFCLNDYEGGFGMINESDEENVQYYIFKVFSQNFNGTLLNSESSVKTLSTFTCKDTNDNIVVIVVNKDSKDIPTSLQLVDKNSNLFYSFKPYSVTLLKLTKNDTIEIKEIIIQ